jgi:ABC-type polysaccharide/polyol phosphate export permease
MVKRDLKVRYRGSLLGYAWSMLNPLLSMTVLAAIFSHVVRIDTASYPLYVLSGLIAWNMFAQSVGAGVNSIINNSFILRKVAVPSWVFPTASISSAALNSVLALVPYLIISLIMRHPLTMTFIQLPIILMLYILFIHGIVMVLSSLNVLFRDIGHVVEPVLQIVFYGSPVLYAPSVIPEKIRNLLVLNPISHFIEAVRAALYNGQWLTLQQLLLLTMLAVVSPLLGRLVYQKTRNNFIYAL